MEAGMSDSHIIARITRLERVVVGELGIVLVLGVLAGLLGGYLARHL